MSKSKYLEVRALVESSWKAMVSLTTTKSNEPSNPFGHHTSVTTKAGDVVVTHHEAVNFSLLGAIMRAFGDNMLLSKDGAAFSKLILKQLQATMPEYAYLQHWEDEKGRTRADILQLLDDTFYNEID